MRFSKHLLVYAKIFILLEFTHDSMLEKVPADRWFQILSCCVLMLKKFELMEPIKIVNDTKSHQNIISCHCFAGDQYIILSVWRESKEIKNDSIFYFRYSLQLFTTNRKNVHLIIYKSKIIRIISIYGRVGCVRGSTYAFNDLSNLLTSLFPQNDQQRRKENFLLLHATRN